MDYSKELPLDIYAWLKKELRGCPSESYSKLLAGLIANNKDLFTEKQLSSLRDLYMRTLLKIKRFQ